MRRLILPAAALLAVWLLARRAVPRPAVTPPAGRAPRPPAPPGPAAMGLREGAWPGQAEALIRRHFPLLTEQDLAAAGGNLERLAALLAERAHRPVHEVYGELLAARELSPREPEGL